MATIPGESPKLSATHPLQPNDFSDAKGQRRTSLLRLPSELLVQVLSYLLKPSRLALQHVCRGLYDPTPPLQAPMATQLSVCERNALYRANEENSNLRSGKRRCVTCGQLAPLNWFRSETAPICNWHDGWLMKRIVTAILEPEIQLRLQGLLPYLDCWVSFERRYCAHSKDIINWDVRDCNCRCEFCGHFKVTCYVRISQTDGRGLELDLVDGNGGLQMLERRRQDSPHGRPQERTMPVVALADL